MISRIFTGAALTGMLLATGCGGGTGSGGVVAPGTGVSTIPGTTSGARGTALVHVLVPIPRAKLGSASTSRKPQYVSPGSSGIQVLIGDGTAYNATTSTHGMQFIIGTAATPAAIPANPQSAGPFAIGSTVYGYQSGASVSYSYAVSSTLGYYDMSISITGLVAGTSEFTAVALTDIGNANYLLSEGITGAGTAVPVSTAVATPVSVPLKPVLASAYIFGPSTALLGAGPYQFSAYAADERGYPIPYQAGLVFDNGSFSLHQYQGAGLTSTSLTFAFYSVAGGLATALASNTSLNPVPVNSTHLVAGTQTATNALVVGQTNFAYTQTVGTALQVGDHIIIGGIDAVTITAVAGAEITVTPALTTPYAAATAITLNGGPYVTPATATWTNPGQLIPNLAFSQTSGAPTTSVAGYTAGQTVGVTATASGTYGVTATGTFTTPTTIPGYTYSPSVNVPATATNVPIGSPIQWVVPAGLGVTAQ